MFPLEGFQKFQSFFFSTNTPLNKQQSQD